MLEVCGRCDSSHTAATDLMSKGISMRTLRSVTFVVMSLLAFASLTTVSCQSEQADSDGPDEVQTPVNVVEMLPTDVGLSGAEIKLGRHVLRLEVYLWRDFMPGPDAPAEGRPLRGVVRVYAVDSSRIADSIDIHYVWLTQGDEVWGVALPEPPTAEPHFLLEKGFADGPQWAPGSTADVTVRVTTRDGATGYLRVTNQLIEKTY